MKDIIEELSNLFSQAPFPIPSAVEMVDKAFAKEMGIDLDTKEPDAANP